MPISNIIIKIYDNILNLNNTEIIILFDNTNSVWFSYINILKSLGYKNVNLQKARLQLDDKYLSTYSNIFNLSNNNKKILNNIQPHMKMISEAGLYFLLSKSNKAYSKLLLEELFTEILPSLRKTGKFTVNSEDKAKLKKLTKKMQLIQKEQTIKYRTSKKYTEYKNSSGKGFIYVLKVKTLKNGKLIICYKIGYAKNLNARLETYKTGHPDIELVHQENVDVSKKQLEKCVLNLNILKRLSSKNEIICDKSLNEIISEINDCKTLIEKHNKNNK